VRALAVIFVLLVVALIAESAHAVTPEQQAILDQRGWTVKDTDPVEQEKVPGRCTFGGRVKSIGSRIEGAGGKIMVRGRLRWSGCAHSGEIHRVQCSYYHDSPGRYWFNVFGPWITRHGESTCRSIIEWRFSPPHWRDSNWNLTINIEAAANGNNIWFPVKRRIWR
jgi:hypothetical protein